MRPQAERNSANVQAPVWLAAALVLGLWLVARPYAGLRHDGILYLGQALLHQRPEVMRGDLFFAFGSQDSFTVFSRVLAWLYQSLDIAPVQVVVLALCQAALLAATWSLLAPLPATHRWLGLCALAVMSHQYGGHGIFAFAERFVTARTLAEPLALLALAALLHRRWWAAGVATVASFAVHPLVALGLVALQWCWLVGHNRRWLWALCLLVPVLVAAALDVAPLNQLTKRFDAAWWPMIETVSGHVFLRTWLFSDYVVMALDALVLALTAQRFAAPWRPLVLAVLAASALLVALSVLAADFGRNVLVSQLQLWRVLWVAHLLALAVLPALVCSTWRAGDAGRLLALALAAAALSAYSRWSTAWLFVALVVLAHIAERFQPRLAAVSARSWKLLVLAMVAVVIGLSLGVFENNWQSVYEAGNKIDHRDHTLLAATIPSISMSLAAWALLAWRPPSPATPMARHHGKHRVLIVGMVLGLLAYGLVFWDRRPLMVRAVESGLHTEHPFTPHISPAAQVYWHGEPAATWVLLRRANHWSVTQGSGLLFNRDTALEFERRHHDYRALDMQERICRMTAALNTEDQQDLSDCVPTQDMMQRICRMERGPDFLIFRRRFDDATASWTVNPGAPSALTWHLYDCLKIR